VRKAAKPSFSTDASPTKDKEFRNVEHFTFDGDRISRIGVYFGATYKNGTFVKEQ
jgi:hypothetical protein